MTSLHAGQPETLTQAVTNEALLEEIQKGNSNQTTLMKQNTELRAEVLRCNRLLEQLTNGVIYTAIKKKENLIKIGHTDNWEQRRKTHESNGWEIVAVQPDVRITEKRFKQQLHDQGFNAIGGKGMDEVWMITDAWLSAARRFYWPLGIYKKQLPYRTSSKFSRSKSGPIQGSMFAA